MEIIQRSHQWASVLARARLRKRRVVKITLSKESQLLFYEDAYLREFKGKISKIQKIGDNWGVVLDRTAFYPTGGGQPGDTGILKGREEVRVVDVRWSVGRVSHMVRELDGKLVEGDQIRGVIDWDRRYALMRNHTAAHIMGEAVQKATGVLSKIVGSAIDAEKARLDFAYHKSLRPLFPKIGEIANKVVEEDRAVEVRVIKRREAQAYIERFNESLETLPAQVQEVRIVEIKDWHACACGGTHVRSTRELGSIELLKRSSKGKAVERLEFSATAV